MKGCGLCQGLRKWGERGRNALQGRKTSSSLPVHVQGKKKHNAIQNDTVLCFSLSLSVSLSLMWTVHEMMLFWTKHAVSFKRKKTPKCVNFRISHSFLICSIKSSIAILILRISSIMSLPKSDVSSKVGHFFSFGHWSRSDLCNLTLNWSINF